MHHTLSGSTVSASRSPTSESQHGNFTFRKLAGIKDTSTALLKPSDPVRQAKRLPIKVVKMLTAHSGHLLHPEYLQPLTSAPVSIEVCYIAYYTLLHYSLFSLVIHYTLLYTTLRTILLRTILIWTALFTYLYSIVAIYCIIHLIVHNNTHYIIHFIPYYSIYYIIHFTMHYSHHYALSSQGFHCRHLFI